MDSDVRFVPIAMRAARGAGSESARRVFAFGPFVLDAERGRLLRHGLELALSKRTLMLLEHLLVHAGRFVTTDELRRGVWRDVRVAEGSVRQAVLGLRRVLDDQQDHEPLIDTVRGRGYRFNGLVEVRRTANVVEVSAAETPVVRAHHLASLRAALANARVGRGSVVYVTGAAGSGKSFLLQALLREACDDWEVHATHATPHAPPLAPVIELVRGYLGARQTGAHVAQGNAAERWLLRSAGPCDNTAWATFRENEAAQREHHEELVSDLCRVSRSRPILFAIEDLHDVDDGTLLFLRALIARMRDGHILLALSARPLHGSPSGMEPLLKALARDSVHQTLELEPLTDDAIARLAASEAPRTPTAAELRSIQHLSQGNPLVATQLARLVPTQPCDSDPFAGQPPEVLSLLRHRLNSLPREALEALRAAAVLGPEFSVGALAQLLDDEPGTLLDVLDQAVGHGVLTEESPALFHFRHALLHQAAYESSSRSQRARLHGRAGDILLRAGALSTATAHAVARHYHLAAAVGRARDGYEHQLRCAEHATRVGSYHLALSHVDFALECAALASELTPAERLSTSLRRAELLRAMGQPSGTVNETFAKLAEEAAQLGQVELFARAALGYAGHGLGRLHSTRFGATFEARELRLLERAQRLLGDQHPELSILIACSLAGQCAPAEREERMADALARAQSSGRAELVLRVHHCQLLMGTVPGTIAARIRNASDCAASAQSLGELEIEAEARYKRSFYWMAVGAFADAHSEWRQLETLVDHVPTPRLRAHGLAARLWQSIGRGELDRAGRYAARIHALHGADPIENAIYLTRVTLLHMLRTGEQARAAETARLMLASYPEMIGLRAALAWSDALGGHREAAAEHVEWLVEHEFARVPRDVNWPSILAMLAEAVVHLELPGAAQQLYDELLPYGDGIAALGVHSFPLILTATLLAQLALCLGDEAAARHWLARGALQLDALDAPFYGHLHRLVEARLLASSSDASARERALHLTTDARAFAERSGLGALRMRTERALV